jgi:hypothetical protein
MYNVHIPKITFQARLPDGICICQMVYFQTKNPNLRIFWWVLQCKMLIYFIAIWSIFWPFGIFYEFICL